MIGNYLLRSLFSISIFFVASTVGREAIIGGLSIIAIFGHSLPYQVSVQIRGHGHCGGGIIDDRFILTTASCVLSNDRRLRNNHISILAGTDNLNSTGPPAVTIRVKKVFFPMEFHPMIAFNHGDIAVLKLVDGLKLEHRKSLRKLELPRNYHPGGIATIAGFGWQEYNETGHGSSNNHLQFIWTHILPESECEIDYPRGAIQSDRHFCARTRAPTAKNRSHGVCFGDGGSPLVHDRTTVIGILSRVPRHCDERNGPGIYTNVAHYLRMILNVMKYDGGPDIISLNA